MTDEKIKRLPVRFKSPLPNDRALLSVHEAPHGEECSHLLAKYIIDPKAAEVECGRCHEKLNPMWVLGQLAGDDRRMAESYQRYTDEMKRLEERSRTTCQHCGKMTPISRS